MLSVPVADFFHEFRFLQFSETFSGDRLTTNPAVIEIEQPEEYNKYNEREREREREREKVVLTV